MTSSGPWWLVPGMMCDAGVFADLVGGLGDCVVQELVMPTVDAAVEELLDLAPRRFDLLGYSLGGVVAMACAAAAPERVSRLVLVAANPSAPRVGQRELWTRWLDQVDRGEFDHCRDEAITDMLGPRDSDDLRTVVCQMADRVGAVGLVSQLRLQLSRRDLRDDLRRVTAPTWFVSGDRDPLCPRQHGEDVAHRVPTCRRSVYADTGHMLPLERGSRLAADMHDVGVVPSTTQSR